MAIRTGSAMLLTILPTAIRPIGRRPPVPRHRTTPTGATAPPILRMATQIGSVTLHTILPIAIPLTGNGPRAPLRAAPQRAATACARRVRTAPTAARTAATNLPPATRPSRTEASITAATCITMTTGLPTGTASNGSRPMTRFRCATILGSTGGLILPDPVPVRRLHGKVSLDSGRLLLRLIPIAAAAPHRRSVFALLT